MKTKTEVYTDLLEKAFGENKYSNKEAKKYLEVVAKKDSLLMDRLEKVVDDIFDTKCKRVYTCQPKTLNDYREYIGVLPKTGPAMTPSARGNFITRLVNDIIFESTMDYYKRIVKETGRPIDLDTSIIKFAMSIDTYNKFCRATPKGHDTLRDLVDLNLKEFKKRRTVGQHTINELNRILDATGYVPYVSEVDLESNKYAEENETDLSICETKIKKLYIKYNELQAQKKRLAEAEKVLDKEIAKAIAEYNSRLDLEGKQSVKR